jgi:hypothetical protein
MSHLQRDNASTPTVRRVEGRMSIT